MALTDTGPSPASYERDYYAWTLEQAARLRTGQFGLLDRENLAEEIESMGISQRNELKNRLRVLLVHLLKWQFQPSQRSSGWAGTISEQRDRLELLLDGSPSLGRMLPDALDYAYPKAVRTAGLETGLPATHFPATCPYPIEQIPSEDYWPD